MLIALGAYTCNAQTTYSSSNGVQSISPTTVVERLYGDTYGVYTVTQGVKSISPIQIIEPYNGHYGVFNMNNNVRSINPVQEFYLPSESEEEEVDEEEPIYYTPYVPNVRSSPQIYQSTGQGDATIYTAPSMRYWGR